VSDTAEHQRNERKSRTESILLGAGIAINPNLPPIEAASEIKLRSAIEIARRALCLLLVAAKGSDLDEESVLGLIESHGVAEFFTKDERAFIHNRQPEDEDKMRFSWRSEASWTLLWSLGFVDALGLPTDQIEPYDAIEIVEKNRQEGLATNASPRTADEILDESDLILRCHWAVRDYQIGNSHVDPELDPDVTLERRHALNWLTCNADQDWDNVSTDT
jgi:hypothetical protein